MTVIDQLINQSDLLVFQNQSQDGVSSWVAFMP
jgi:hypothetical protein